MTNPVVSIIILSWNSQAVTANCLNSILKTDQGLDYEIIIIDNASTDGSAEWLQQQYGQQQDSRVTVVCNSTNVGYAQGNNQGYNISRGRYLLILNSDTILLPNTLSVMVQWLEQHADYAATTAALHNLDGTTQYYMHRRFPTAWSLGLALLHKRWPGFKPEIVKRYLYLDKTFTEDFDIEQAAGTCIMLKRSAVEQLGELFDEERFPLYYNDVDLSRRIAKHGLKIRCLCSNPVTHAKGTSVRKLSLLTNAREYSYGSMWYFRKHKQYLSHYALRFGYAVLFTCLGQWSLVKQALTLQPAPGLLGHKSAGVK